MKNMNEKKRQQIKELFSNFKCKDFYRFNEKHQRPDFSCEHYKDGECGVDKSKEPIWAPAYGADDTKVMVIAQAPAKLTDSWSPLRGPGPHVPGLFKDWPIDENQDRGLFLFRKFLADMLNDMPYFTDLIKCGPADAGNKTTIKMRANYCIEKYLLEEIKIIKPSHIFCLGDMSFKALDHIGLNRLSKLTGETVVLKKLLHYSAQANLPVNPKDKELIWRWQLGALVPEKSRVSNRESLSSLSFFNT
jgi:uracil-DNA glycosylase